ncbi:MAG: UDP-glucose 4-epimerase GalE [Saprospiraceae bacterium]|nr:UDP-glucose 4-epimerase GalE [Saprospiraceae bacterium]
MQKVIVTGGTGYIGSHTVVQLLGEGFEVVIIDNLLNSEASALDGIEKITGQRPLFYQVDLLDYANLQDVLALHKDAVACIHFASLKAVAESMERPLWYYRNNLNGMTNLLEGLRSASVEHVIFSSSASVYGNTTVLPITEALPARNAVSAYGISKQVGEELIDAALVEACFGSAISLRYFNPIGAHSSALIGELPKGRPNNLMPYITQTAAGIRQQLTIFGKDYPTPDGTAVRDYLHVEDVATAHVKALMRLLNGKNEAAHEAFNLGSGNGYSVLEIVQAFERANSIKLNYVFAERRPGDVAELRADASLAVEKLGWTAQRSLEDMVRSAWAWERKARGL